MEKNIDAQILHTVVIHAAIRFSLTDSKAVSSPANASWPLVPNFCSWISQVQIFALGSLQVFVGFKVDFCYSCLREEKGLSASLCKCSSFFLINPILLPFISSSTQLIKKGLLVNCFLFLGVCLFFESLLPSLS